MKGEEEDENHAICKFYTWPLHVEFRVYIWYIDKYVNPNLIYILYYMYN
jgi:hypothetical protein